MTLFDADDFLRRAAERLHAEPPGFDAPLANLRGDHEGQVEPVDLPHPEAVRPAAVLVPVILHPEATAVLLTQRSQHLRKHAGQIAFPGGRIDPADRGPAEAALREAFEEIGLEQGSVRPLGFLDAYLTGTGFRVVPLVAQIKPGSELVLNPGEVDEAFEVPLGILMDPARHERHSRQWQGAARSYYAIPVGERYIWGATAGIIRNLYERLYLP